MLNYLLKIAAALSAVAVLALLPAGCAADAAASVDASAAKPTPPASLVVVAIAKVQPGQSAAFIKAVAGILVATRAEAGNLRFEFQESAEDPTEFAFVERWSSGAAIDAHMKAPHMLQFFRAAGPLFAPGYPTIKRYLPREPGQD